MNLGLEDVDRPTRYCSVKSKAVPQYFKHRNIITVMWYIYSARYISYVNLWNWHHLLQHWYWIWWLRYWSQNMKMGDSAMSIVIQSTGMGRKRRRCYILHSYQTIVKSEHLNLLLQELKDSDLWYLEVTTTFIGSEHLNRLYSIYICINWNIEI